MNANTMFLVISLAATLAMAQYGQNSNGQGQRGGPPQMDESTKAAFDACASEINMPKPGSGSRPTKEQHEALRACLKAKGVEMPEPHGRGGQPPEAPPEE